MTIATEGGHWYEVDGTPAYEVLDRKGNMRPTTLRDARKLNLFPSFSMVKDAIAAPALVNYYKNQVALAAAENPRGRTEGVQAYMDRILALSRVHAETARDKGTAIHTDIEKAMKDTVWMPRPEAAAAIKTLGEWCGFGGYHIEKSFSHPLGYGGKCDIHKEGFLADFKGKEFDESWVPVIYDNHHMQLAAYREGFGMPNARGAIIFVSTSVPGLTRLVEAPQSQLEQGWELFKAALKVWQVKNKYVPQLAKETV